MQTAYNVGDRVTITTVWSPEVPQDIPCTVMHDCGDGKYYLRLDKYKPEWYFSLFPGRIGNVESACMELTDRYAIRDASSMTLVKADTRMRKYANLSG